MKRFCKKIVLFILPLLLLLISMEVFLRELPNDYSYKRNYLDSHSSEIEILILGNSHSYYGLNPIYFFQNTFNASHVSQSLDYDLAVYSRYHDRLENIRTIIIPISYFTLWGNLESGVESWRIKNYTIYYGFDNLGSFKNNFELLSTKMSQNIVRILSYFKNGPEINCSELGWGTGYTSQTAQDLVSTGLTACQRHSFEDIYEETLQSLLENNISILREIIELDPEIQIVLYTPPASKTYYSILNRQQLSETIRTAENIANEYNNCRYYNLLECDYFKESDFWDADHLNDIGAEKLSLLFENLLSGNQIELK